MRKTKLLKSLLVVAALLVGSTGAWADIDYNYDLVDLDFSADASITSNWTTGNGMAMAKTLRSGENYYCTMSFANGSNAASTADYAFPDLSSYQAYKISFLWGMYSASATARYNQFKIVGASSDFATTGAVAGQSDAVTLTAGATSTTLDVNKYETGTRGNANRSSTLYKITIEGVSSDADAVNHGVYLTITTEDGLTSKLARTRISNYQVMSSLHFESGQFFGQNAIDDLLIQAYAAVEIVPNPTAAITGVNGIDRTVTLTLGSGSADGTTMAYSTNSDMSESTTYTTPFTVSTTGTIYFQSTSPTSATSEIQSIEVTCENITLNAPVISRSGNSVTITSDQSKKLLNPAATIYYTYGGGALVAYSGPITVTKDATIEAYASATGYTNSDNVSRAVALFPAAGISQVENAVKVNYTTGGLSGDEVVGENGTYQTFVYDGTQWGSKIYVCQTGFGNETTGWNFRNNNTWINSSARSVNVGWLMLKDMKAGDIIVFNVTAKGVDASNATYSEKYSEDNKHVYIVDADGNAEIGFRRAGSGSHNVLDGISAYTHTVTGTQIGAFDCSTGWKGAISTPLTLKPGDSFRYQFVNYTNGDNVNDQNWQLIVANPSTDADILEIRADWWENLHGSSVAQHQQGFTSDAANYWTNVPSKMNGATVDMTVTFNADKTFTMTSTTTAADNSATWTYNWSSASAYSTDLTDYSSLKVYLTCAKNWLDLTSEAQTAVSVTTTAAGKGFATLYTPYALDFSEVDGLAAYTATLSDNTVRLTEVDDIPANTGVVLKSETVDDNTTYSIPVIASSSTPRGSLTGSATTATAYNAVDGYYLYMLALNGEYVQFTKVTEGSIAAGKAYLPVLSGGGEARELRVVFADDETTGIKMVHGEGLKVNGSVFNLNGQRVAQPAKGLYIKGGKKVVMK